MPEEIKNDETVDVKTTQVDEVKPENNTSETTEKTKEETPEESFVPQSKVDEIVTKRLKRERDKFSDYDDLKAKLSDYEKAEKERQDAELSEVERLQKQLAEYEKSVEEAEQQKQTTLQNANQRLIKSEFKLLAKESGVRQDALDAAFKLADFSEVDVDDDGNVKGVDDVLKSLKESNKFLFGSTEYADPSPGQHETKRDKSKEQAKAKLEALEAKARKTGRIADKVAYASYKKELGL